MRRKPYPIPNLTGGLNVGQDPVYLEDKDSPDQRLVRYYQQRVCKDYELSALTASLSSAIQHVNTYTQLDGDSYLMGCTLTGLYYYSEASGAWSTISSSAFTGTSMDYFCSTTFNDLFIVTNGKDNIKKWNGSTLANLGGSPPLAKWLIPFYSRLVLLNVTSSGTRYPYRVQWSVVGDPETWTGTGSGIIDLIESQDSITAAVLLGDRLFIFRETSIWELYYVGGTQVFRVRLIASGVGALSPRAIISTAMSIYFLGLDGVYQFNGSTLKRIDKQVWNLLSGVGERSIVSLSSIRRSFSGYDFLSNRLHLAVPTSTNDQLGETLLSYDTINGVWTVRRSQSLTCCGLYNKQVTSASSASWSSTSYTWATFPGTWQAEAALAGAPVLVFGDSSGYVRAFSDTAVPAQEFTFTTKDFVFAHAVRLLEVRFLVKASSFRIRFSYDHGTTWGNWVTLYGSSSEFTDVVYQMNETVEVFRIQISSSYSDGVFELKWIEPWYIDRKRPM